MCGRQVGLWDMGSSRRESQEEDLLKEVYALQSLHALLRDELHTPFWPAHISRGVILYGVHVVCAMLPVTCHIMLLWCSEVAPLSWATRGWFIRMVFSLSARPPILLNQKNVESTHMDVGSMAEWGQPLPPCQWGSSMPCRLIQITVVTGTRFNGQEAISLIWLNSCSFLLRRSDTMIAHILECGECISYC